MAVSTQALADDNNFFDSPLEYLRRSKLGMAWVPLKQCGCHPRQRPLDADFLTSLANDYAPMLDYRVHNPIFLVPEELPDDLAEKLRRTSHHSIISREEMASWPDVRFLIIDGQHRHQSALSWIAKGDDEVKQAIATHPNLMCWPAFILDPSEYLTSVIS